MIEINSPTRVDLSGGTLDCWPLFLLVPEAVTVNLAIAVQTTARLEPRKDSRCRIEVVDLSFTAEFENVSEFLASTEEKLLLVREVVRVLEPKMGFNLRTSSQSPVGAGLGGSSSLTISIIKAFKRMMGHEVTESQVQEIVHLAHNIEARILRTPTGTQDYVPAYLGGLNAIHYRPGGMSIEHIPMNITELSKHLMLIYTGRPHHSGLNNWQVIKSAIEKDKKTIDSLLEIADLSHQIYTDIKSNYLRDLPRLFNLESEARIKLSPGFSSPEINKLRTDVLQMGGDALKICGAGGGGSVLIWADPELHASIEGSCEKSGFKRLALKPVDRIEKKPIPLIEAY